MDRFDVLAVVGLVLLAVGLGAIYWPLAPLVAGTLILVAVVYKARQGETDGNRNESGPPAGESGEH